MQYVEYRAGGSNRLCFCLAVCPWGSHWMSLVLPVHSWTQGQTQTPRNHESEIREESNFPFSVRDPQVFMSETLSSLASNSMCRMRDHLFVHSLNIDSRAQMLCWLWGFRREWKMQNPYSPGAGILAGKSSKSKPIMRKLRDGKPLLFIHCCIPYPVNSVWPTKCSVNIHGMME